ncbi:protein SCO1/2 [Halobacillus alkaliphilus]|uniref:Protein SCO1/2 n=1 Tax=Halobacillus alkaliphilus TaxID=396056 RepID=A0A1I2RH37_9BACI|nr:SCO family protein [Halobacillus alkaliphilus]SFG39975.1 protein SCO1/2 [Halobacillus alkaliphilus]
MKHFILLSMTLLFTILLAGCGSGELENTLDWETQNFKATTQEETDFAVEDMEGKVWLADFIFTSCNTVCPPMTRNMAQIQEQLQEKDIEAEIVSFSVDPTVDSPDELKEFGNKHGVDFSNWTFVTGYTQEEIQNFAQESFNAPVQKTEGNDQVTHGTSFYLVGKNGNVLKKYRGDTDVPYDQIIEDVKTAAN